MLSFVYNQKQGVGFAKIFGRKYIFMLETTQIDSGVVFAEAVDEVGEKQRKEERQHQLAAAFLSILIFIYGQLVVQIKVGVHFPRLIDDINRIFAKYFAVLG